MLTFEKICDNITKTVNIFLRSILMGDEQKKTKGRDNKWDVKNMFKFYHIMIDIVSWVYTVHFL